MDYQEALQARKIIEDNLLAIGIVDDGDDGIKIEFVEGVEIFEFPPEEDRVALDIGDVVKLVNPSVYTPELLDMDETEFQEFLKKAATGETALVFDVDDDYPQYVGVIWEDGLEAVNIHRMTLKICIL